MHRDNPSALRDAEPIEAGNYISAILNILDDSAEEKAHLANTQRAVLNILEDAASERSRLDGARMAVLNILEDSTEEKAHLANAQRAVLNILDDAASERSRLDAAQKAVLNILEDSTEEKAHLANAQRAILNILDDFDVEKKKVGQANLSLRNEVAERERTEEALRHAKDAVEGANRELETFAYSVSHDLRAPLRSMTGFCQALVEDYGDRLDDTGKDYVRRVVAASKRMGQLIDDLLTLSRVTRTDITRSKVDLSCLAQTVAEQLRRAEPGRDVEFKIQPGVAAEGDETLLRTVIENLIGNAWKYSAQKAHATIEFGAAPDGVEATYYVRDDGIGFDMAHADKLFKPFQRLHSNAEFEGTGIGLASAANIVRRHGGRIWAESRPGAGTTMRFTL